MPLTASITAATPDQHELSAALVPGLLALGVATAVQTIAPLPSQHTLAQLVPVLLLCALLQIGVGLFEWRRERTFFAATFIAFGLLTCAEIHLLGLRTADSQAVTGGVSLLILWSLFALLMAAAAEEQGRLFRAVLAAVAVTLLAKALVLGCGLTSAWLLIALPGLATVALAGYASIRILTSATHG